MQIDYPKYVYVLDKHSAVSETPTEGPGLPLPQTSIFKHHIHMTGFIYSIR